MSVLLLAQHLEKDKKNRQYRYLFLTTITRTKRFRKRYASNDRCNESLFFSLFAGHFLFFSFQEEQNTFVGAKKKRED